MNSCLINGGMHLRLLKLGIVITPVSLRLWKSSGRISAHSIDVGIWSLHITGRCAAKASQIIKMNIIRATNDNSEPNEDTTFHFINASG